MKILVSYDIKTNILIKHSFFYDGGKLMSLLLKGNSAF